MSGTLKQGKKKKKFWVKAVRQLRPVLSPEVKIWQYGRAPGQEF